MPPEGPRDYLKLGVWNAFCDKCKFKFKSDELRKDWKGLMVCPSCFEPRHPMDFQQPPRPSQPIPWTRPTDEKVGGIDVAGDVIDGTVYASVGSGTDSTIPTGTFTTNNSTL